MNDVLIFLQATSYLERIYRHQSVEQENKQNQPRNKMIQNLNRILRSPLDEDADLSGIDTSYPRLVAGTYDLLIDKAEKKASQNDSSKEYLEVIHKTTSLVRSTGGEDLPAGFVVTNRISLTPTEKNTEDKIKQRVAGLVQAVGLKSMKELCSPLASGKLVTTKVKVTPENGQYDESNSFNYIVKR